MELIRHCDGLGVGYGAKCNQEGILGFWLKNLGRMMVQVVGILRIDVW